MTTDNLLTLHDAQKRAIDIRQKYDALNKRQGRSPWGGKEYAMGLVSDVGELLELIMAKENLRSGEDVDAKLRHELSDCLWSILTIANYYGVDMQKEFLLAMGQLEKRVVNT